MSDEFKNADFLDDEEKMRDFTYLTKKVSLHKSLLTSLKRQSKWIFHSESE